MPKNTYFIKENYKKVEEVREIENEIPSYEEFLKNYNVDEKVNDSYENELNSYSDIGVSKGFGPCHICYKDTQWTDLYIPCPASGCSSRNFTYFTHTLGCGSRLEVSNKAKIRCSGCSFTCDLKDYRFTCSNHSGEYRTMDRYSLDKSLSMALMMGRVSEVVRDLVTYTSNHN